MKKFARFTKAIGFLLIVLFMGTSVVAADYIGPDRTYTVQEATSCGYRFTGSGYSACGANGYLGDPCTCNITCDTCLTGTGNCISIPSNIVDDTCGDGFGEADRWVNYTNRTISHPLAVASTVWSCPVPGSNGWCHSPFQVQLNGVDNYSSAGYYITALEGVLDGVPFFADAVDTITIQIEEGTHHLDFWALSSYGDSSYHFIENYYVDTVNPVINASLNGTPGEHDWFVSNTTLTVTFTDPAPGSGVDFTRALSNGVDFSVVNPVTFTEGVYFLQLDVRDYAGHTAQTLYNLMVDTTPPAVTANQPPVELAVDGIAGGGYVNGSVVFSGTCSDATSGVNRIEISTDGSALTSIAPNPDGTWTLDWDSSMLPDGTYTPVITAVDNAGNRTDITMQPLTLDNSAPAMSITGGWYIWDSGHIVVYDSRAGIQRIELSVRDDQNRWPAREWDYDTSKLEMDLQWDREFGDGTVAPPGTYDVLLQAWDRLGNGRWLTAHIYIPEAGATAVIPYEGMLTAGNAEPTGTPVPTQPVAGETPVVAAGAGEPQPTKTPVPTSTTVSVPISGGEDSTLILAAADKSGDSAPANTTPISSGILWGAAAMAAGAAAAIVSQKQLEETRKKEQAKLDAAAQERMIQRWSNVVASYGGTYDHEAEVKRIAEKEKFWHDYWVASQEKYIEEQRIKANEEAAAAAAYAEFLANNPEAATMIAYQERMKSEQEAAQKAAEEYSNQIKAFRDGEEASNASYQQYQTKQFHEKEQDDLWNIQQENLKAFHENEAQAYAAYLEQQKENEANQEKQKELVRGYTVPDYMKDSYLGTGPSSESVFTPDDELQEVIDANIAKQVEDKPTIKDVFANILNSASAGLGSLSDPEIHPIIAALTEKMADPSCNKYLAAQIASARGSVYAWGDVVSMTFIMADYTQKAFEEGRWSDGVRGLLGLTKGGYAVMLTYPVGEAIMWWSLITTPIRLFTTSLPQFFDAAGDRLQGKDNALDVLYTGFVALGDAYFTGSMVKAAVPSLSAKSSFGELMTAEEAARYNSWWENAGKSTGEGGMVSDIVAGSNDALKGSDDIGNTDSAVSSSGDTPISNTNESLNLTRTQKVTVETLDNVIEHNLTEDDFSGTLGDLQGNPIIRDDGYIYDHQTEMVNTYRCLQKINDSLSGSLKNPNLDPITRAYLQSELEIAAYYIQRIENLFNPFGGVK